MGGAAPASPPTAALPPAPRFQLNNPIFTRELLTLLRNPRSFLLLGVSLVVSAGAVLSNWPADVRGIVGQGELSRQIFAFFSLAQMLILGFVVPGTLAASMTSEKEKETIDLLLTSPLSGDTIVFGKLLSGLGYLFLLGLASLPVLMFCSVIGGLSGEDVLALYATLACQGVVYGLTAICCSAFSRRTVVAVMVSYLLVALEAALFVPLAGDVHASFSAAFLASLPLYLIARHAVRRPYNPVPKPPPKQDPRRDSGLVLDPNAFPDKLLLPPPREGVLPDGVNPVLAKELMAGINGSGSGFVRALIQLGLLLSLLAFFYGLSMLAGSYTKRHPADVFHPFIVLFAMTLGPAIGARAFSGEREGGTAEMLCLVVLPRWDLVTGKFLAHLRVVGTLTAINTCPYLAFIVFGADVLHLAILIALVVSSSVLSISVGFWASLSAPTTIGAMFRSYGVLFLVFVLPGVAALLLDDVSAVADVTLRVLNPLRAGDIRVSTRGAVPWDDVLLLGVHLIVVGLGCWGVLAYCARRFDRHMRLAAER